MNLSVCFNKSHSFVGAAASHNETIRYELIVWTGFDVDVDSGVG